MLSRQEDPHQKMEIDLDMAWHLGLCLDLGESDTVEIRKHPRPPKRLRQVKNGVKNSSRALPETDSPEYIHNIEHGRLHQFPVELLLQVGEYLTLDAIFAIRLSCRDFYQIYSPPFIIGPDERDAFKIALRRDALSWYCRWEHFKGLPNLIEATCSKCESRHSISQFSTVELAKAPEHRACIGASVLKLCHHQSFTFCEIRKAAYKSINDIHLATIQTYWISASIESIPLSAPLLISTIGYGGLHGQCNVARTFRLLHLSKSEKLVGSHVANPLSAVLPFLCQHVNAQDLHPEAVKVVERRPIHHSLGWSYYDDIGSCHECAIVWVPCGDIECGTKYTLFRRKLDDDAEMEEIMLTMWKRYEGNPGSADPAWAADLADRLASEQSKANRELIKSRVKTTLFKSRGLGDWTWGVV
ncbi:hypothetical protein K469DRAFT_753075 [Zopfia rhizophila CBS 207.26]|uniref:F-box domain-containing protein n=1 Tax=Zopfia rhizophila CBS 207.26 TaxID=1314779 RepID=A0A6A6DRY8_9PEZI|nr:hypothetical protein K469DRAFT_753075 [Zopfia rhizophila CBS 207.26]